MSNLNLSWTDYKGLSILSPTPIGDGGQKLNNNFTTIGDKFDQTLPLTGGTLSGNLGLSSTTGAIVFNDTATIQINGSDLSLNCNLMLPSGQLQFIADCTIGTDGESGIQITDFNGNSLIWNTHHGLGLQITGDSCGIKFPDGTFQGTAATGTSTPIAPAIGSLAASGTAGQLGLYNSTLYYYTGTVWRRAAGQFTGV